MWKKAASLCRRHPDCSAFSLFFAAAFLRWLPFGIRYYPLLDDYIQYHNYPTSLDYSLLIETEGLLASRPLAGLGDLYFWQYFWRCPVVALLLLSALFAGAAALFWRVFRRRYNASLLFAVLFAFFPLGIEGSYWLSAATRLVPGLFFTALALQLYQTFVDTALTARRKIPLLLCLFAALLLSYGFYEQILVLSLSAMLLFGMEDLLRRRSRGLAALLALPAGALYYFFTAAHASGNLTARMKIILPVHSYYFDTFLPELIRQLRAVFLQGNFALLTRGFARGLRLLWQQRLWLFALFILLAAAATAGLSHLLDRKNALEAPRTTASAQNTTEIKKASVPTDASRYFCGILFGFLLFLAPLAPYFIVEGTWFSFRGALPSLCGLFLLCDRLCSLLFLPLCRRKPLLRRLLSPLIGVAVAFCLICTVSEVYDYRAVHQRDEAVVASLANTLKEAHLPENKRIALFNLDPTVEEQNYLWHEHVCGVTENSWSLTGMLYARQNIALDGSAILPISFSNARPDGRTLAAPESEVVYSEGWNRESLQPDTFDLLYWYHPQQNRFERVFCIGEAGDWQIVQENGTPLCRIYDGDGAIRYARPLW